MAYLSHSIPSFKCFVRKNFLYNQERGHGEFVPAICFGVSSIKNRALGFHVMCDNGGVFWRLPLSALSHNQQAKDLEVGEAQLWDNISYNIAVTEYEFLKGREATLKPKSSIILKGSYLFTIDYAESDYAESADEHKCSHIFKGVDGNFYSLPNNRVLWKDSSFVTKGSKTPDWLVNTHIYYCETDKATEETDKYFYEFSENSDK